MRLGERLENVTSRHRLDKAKVTTALYTEQLSCRGDSSYKHLLQTQVLLEVTLLEGMAEIPGDFITQGCLFF